MTDLMRRLGFGLMIIGVALVAVWAIRPLGFVWPWIRGLPLPLRLGVVAAAAGLAVLLGSLIHERFREHEEDKTLRDDL